MPFELLVEYYEDLFEDDPYAVLDAMRGADGEIVFEDVEDPLIAKWEQELAAGLEPDLEEGLSDREKQKLAKERAKAQAVKGKAEQVVANDDFTKRASTAQRPDARMYESKFVVPGSEEDIALRRATVLGRAQASRQQLPVTLGAGMTPRGRR